MQTLFKFPVVLLVALSWGCSDTLEISTEEAQTEPVSLLTIAVQDADAPVFSGSFQLAVIGPKDFVSTQTTQSVTLENLPPGEYTISVSRQGYIPFKKQIRVAPSTEEDVEQRYRVDVLLVKQGLPFKFSNATGSYAMFPSGTAAPTETPFPEASGLCRYNSVGIGMQPCSLEGADCNGEMQLSASIIPMYAEILSGTAPSGQISLFLLDLEAAKPYILSKPLQVNFPVKLDSDPIRALEYRMVRMENDPVSGVLKFSTETVPVSISTDGSRGSAQISNVNADWMLVAQGKLESSTALTGFSPVAKSVKPGKGVSATVTLGTVLDPLFADLMGLTNPEIALKEAIEIAPLRNKTTEVSMNIMVRKINLRNPATNGVIFSIDNMPNYPVGVKRTVVIPHDSGGA